MKKRQGWGGGGEGGDGGKRHGGGGGGGGGGDGEGGRGRAGGGGRAHTCIMTHMAGNGGKRRLPGVRTAAAEGGSERKINEEGSRVSGLLGWKPLMFQIHALPARCVYGKRTLHNFPSPCS